MCFSTSRLEPEILKNDRKVPEIALPNMLFFTNIIFEIHVNLSPYTWVL